METIRVVVGMLLVVGLLSLGLSTLTFGKINQTIDEALITTNIKFLDAQDHEFEIREFFKINVNHEDLLRFGGASNLTVRVFAGEREQLIEKGGMTTRDNCRLYSSLTYDAKDYNGGLKIGLQDASGWKDLEFRDTWLGVSEEGEIINQPYTLVLEKRNGIGNRITLHPDEISHYFFKGFTFVLKVPSEISPDRKRYLVERKKMRIKKVTRESLKRAESAPGTAKCISYHRVLIARLLTGSREALVCEAMWPGSGSRHL